MATQVQVFGSGMNAGYLRFYLTRKTPSTLEEAFTVALREDYSVSASQAFDVSRPLVHDPEPEPMEVDAIQSYRGRREPTSPSRQSSTRGSRPMKCFRCGKPGHRAAVCRAPSPMAANATTVNDVAAPKKGRRPVGAGRPTGCVRSDGSLAAEPPPSPPVLHARLSATTAGGDSRLIVLSLHVEGAQRPIRALLDSGATNNFVRAASLPALPADMSIRESGGEMIVNHGPDSVTHAAPEESDGPSCAVCEYATCAGPEQASQDASDVVEHGFPRPDEQRFSEEDDDDVVEHGFSRPDEQWLSPGEDDEVV
ncbi:unnamed protein product [Phytophthora fragariaefolia]|uniref:Unnamed protein product n=1 Tax=Phytophthora fragariaefolia TaxID=1490495 RepID=A0A9W6U893_9STRA|nr:unnamed protein product [Phytophthora fragariaefolia]